jgi:hypothetical protein
MKKIIRLATCILLLGFGAERLINNQKLFAAEPKGKAKKTHTPKTPSGKKANAKELVGDTRKALAFMVKSARADKGLDSKTPKNKPFWKATQKIAKQLDRAEKGLAAKSDEFFKGISDARAAEEQMKIDWQLTGSKNKEVIEGGKKLGHALAILRTDFSKEAARKKKGGELTAKEKQEFEKIKAQQQAFLAKVSALRAKAKNDKALEHGLKKLEASANRIVKAPETVDAFVATLYAVDEIEGMLYGYDYYVDKEWQAEWGNVETLTSEWEVTYEEFETSETYEWSETEVSVDIAVSEEVDISVEISEEEIQSEESYAESESFDMTEAEEEEVAAEEDTDAEVDSDDADDDDSMDDDSDDDGGDDDGGDDDGGGDEE